MSIPYLEIRLFGSFGVLLAGEPLPPLRSRTEKWLLMLLALRPGHAVAREWLAATLWPDSETAQGLYNLRRSLTNLRKALDGHADLLLSPTPQTLCLDRTQVRVDAADFDVAIAEASIESLERAAALYRGPLMEDCTEDWALTARIEREQAYLAALETLAAHWSAHNKPAAAVRYLRLTIAADPLREAAHGALMQALADCGDYAALTQVYRDLRLLLHRELSIAPAAETEALYRRLQQQSKHAVLPPPLPSAQPQRRLQVPLTSLVGREADLADVINWLKKARLVTLLGAGGIGKTRLAIAAAEAVASDYPDGVWFVELASLTDPALVASAIAITLGVKEETGRPLMDTLSAALASRSLLLILDNCEHLLDACAAAANELLASCPGLQLLTTSREALGVVGEQRYHTPSLMLPPIVSEDHSANSEKKSLNWLMSYGAMQLFVERATQVHPSFRLTAQNAESVLGVVQDLDGIPLAIELAAARVRTLPISEIQSRLHDRFRLLTGGSRTALPRQQTLRALIDWSYDLLTEREKSLLLRLSVFAGGWTQAAAEAVCANSRDLKVPGESRQNKNSSVLMADEVLDLLTALGDKSLVVYEEQDEGPRYRLLETVRQYARDRLLESGEAAAYRSRHRDFFLEMAELADHELKGRDQGQWLTRLEREHDNLRQALSLCLEDGEGGESGLKLGAALQRFWQIRGHFNEGRETLTALLALPETQQHTKALGDALNAAGRLAYAQGDYASARPLLEQSLAIGRELGERQSIAAALLNLADVTWRQGDYGSAHTLQAESLKISQELSDLHGIANALANQAVVVYSQGDYVAARILQEESLAIKRASGDRHGIASALVNMGLIAWNQGDYAVAGSLYEESRDIFRELGNKQGISLCLSNQALVAYSQGNYIPARTLQEESLAIRRELGDRPGIANSLGNLSILAHLRGDYVSSRALQEESLAIRRELGDRHGIATSLVNLGNLASDLGDYDSAHSLYQQSLEIRQELGDRHGIALSLNNMALVAYAQGDYGSANALQKESLEIKRELGNRQGIAESLEGIASLNVKWASYERAARLWAAAERLRQEIGSPQLSSDQEEQDNATDIARTALGEADFAAAWAQGQIMTLESAIEYALDNASVYT